jgi:nicotinamidase-related amidase
MAQRAYREGRATFELDPRRSALLTIDMQDEFVRPGWTAYWVPEATRILPRVARFIAFCRTLAIPVIYTAFAQTHHRLDRPEAGASMPNRYPFDSEDWFRDGRIVDDLKPQPDDVVIFKPSYGAFYDTPSADDSSKPRPRHDHHLWDVDELLLRHDRAPGIRARVQCGVR